jgi:leucine dehydrogenase
MARRRLAPAADMSRRAASPPAQASIRRRRRRATTRSDLAGEPVRAILSETTGSGDATMPFELFDHPDFDDHRRVLFAHDAASGLRAIIAIHDLTRGPALGGVRLRAYAEEGEAVADALRLSRGMSFKAALAGLPLGGGKSVILAGAEAKTPALMRAMGRAVESLGGAYIAAEDVGITVADMDLMATETAHVAGVSSGVGDPSPWTAEGVFLCLQAAARRRFGALEGRRVVVKGLGAVGGKLADKLHAAGARLVVADIDAERVARAVAALCADSVPVADAHAVPADVYAPCALGAEFSAETVPQLGASVICGAANNQLATAEDGARLASRGVLYCPDYLVNAGGLIRVSMTAVGLSEAEAAARLASLPETLDAILDEAERTGRAPDAVADARADPRRA